MQATVAGYTYLRTDSATTVTVQNTGTVDVRVGPNSDAASSGTTVAAGASADVPASRGYLIAFCAGSTTVTVTGVGLFEPASSGGYAPPAGGIPKPDLAAPVQASLGRADVSVPVGVAGIVNVSGLLGPISRTPPRRTGTLVTSWQAGHGWSVTGTGATSNVNDTGSYVMGSQSAQGTSAGSGAATNMRRTGLPNIDMTGRSLRMLIRVDGLARLSSLLVYAGSGALANFYLIPIYNPGDGTTLIDGQWCWLEFNFNGASAATVTGTPSKATITDFQIRWVDDGTGPVTVHFQALTVVPTSSAYPNGVVSIQFDDTWVDQFTNAAPILDKYGFPASAMTIADQVGADAAHMSMAQIKSLSKWNGWEVAGHAYTAANHNARFDTLTPTALDNELRALKAWMVANGFGQYDYLAYPGGTWNEAVEDAVSRYFSMARTIVTGPAQVLPMAHPLRVRSKSSSNTTTAAQLQTLIDNAYANQNWLVLTFHQILPVASSSTQMSTATFTAVVDYLASKGIPVATAGEVMRAASV